MHESVKVGDQLLVTRPRNFFPLEDLGGSLLLLAGGVGITPILAMLYELERNGTGYELHYCARSRSEAAFVGEIEALCERGRLHLHFDGGDPTARLPVSDLLRSQGAFAGVYACGPRPFLDAVLAGSAHWPSDRVRIERCSAVPKEQVGIGEPFEIRILSTNEVLQVGPGETALSALRRAGYAIRSNCEGGVCGTCKVGVVSGEPIHMDSALRTSERRNYLIVCVSRAKSQVVLDL